MDKKIFTITELTRLIKGDLETHYPEVWVEGEVSNFRSVAVSGHLYFTLKDAGAQMKAVMFKHAARQGLRFELEDGMQVLAHGRVSVYEARGEYQILLERMEPKGLGALQMAFEQLKKKLQAEGLFEAGRKRGIPRFPRKVGIITSPTGSVIHDMLSVSLRRCPWVDLLLFPVKVQGEGAAEEISRAILAAQDHAAELDLLVLARGGGSLEDLWAFNEEAVARAIASSALPVVSAVGHETDFTIADFVADLRAPTPSAAAELFSAGRQEVEALCRQYEGAMGQAMAYRLEDLARQGETLSARLRQADPRSVLNENLQRLDEQDHRLNAAWRNLMASFDERLQGLSGRLEALSPLAILSRGYAAVFSLPEKKVIKKASDTTLGQSLEVMLGKGRLKVKVEGVQNG